MKSRVFLQPLMASIILAIKAGVHDARAGEPPISGRS
jgi:hypothetical protein